MWRANFKVDCEYLEEIMGMLHGLLARSSGATYKTSSMLCTMKWIH